MDDRQIHDRIEALVGEERRLLKAGEAGQRPDLAEPRPPGTVEGYLQ